MRLNFTFESQFAYVNPAKNRALAHSPALRTTVSAELTYMHRSQTIAPSLCPFFAATGAVPALCQECASWQRLKTSQV